MSTKSSRFFRLDKKFIAIFVIIIAAFGALVLFSGQAAVQNPPAPAIYLTPTDVTYGADQTFTVDIRAKSGSTSVSAIGFKFTYPTSLLEFQSLDTTNTAFETIIDSETYGGSGTVSFEAGSAVGGTGISGDNYVATVTFKTLSSTGTADLSPVAGAQLISYDDFSNLVSSSDVYGASFTVDNSAPTVSITSPTNNSSLTAGSTVTISANASDNTSVSAVDILVDGSVKTTLSSSPYNYSWNTAGLSLGSHTIQAKARDPQGNVGNSPIINVTLADKTAPTITLTAPANNATVAGNVTLSATASDNAGGTGMSKVEFYVQDVLVNTDTSSPYSYSWNSTSLVDGSYTVYAKAYDSATPANTKTTNTITINVDNTDDVPPTSPGNFRTTSNSLSSISLAWNASTDNEGVTGYRISRNGSVIATVSTLSYTDTGLTDGTSYNYSVVAIDAAGNSSSPSAISASTKQLKTGDFNRDDSVDLGDLALMLSKWGQADSNIDLDDSGIVDLVDLAMFLKAYPKT